MYHAAPPALYERTKVNSNYENKDVMPKNKPFTLHVSEDQTSLMIDESTAAQQDAIHVTGQRLNTQAVHFTDLKDSEKNRPQARMLKRRDF